MRNDIFLDDNGVRRFDLQKIFGRGYTNGLFFNFKGRYRFYVGSRASKKSQDILGYEIIFRILSDDRVNVVVCRQNDVDNKNSCYANLVSCIEDLGLTNDFQTRVQPLEIEYKRTHQKIIFKGLNNPTSITSTKFPHGILAAIYIEEAWECANYADFLKLDGSLRTDKITAQEIPLQITCVMNPWSAEHWIFQNFFKGRLEPTEEYMEKHKYDDYVDENFVGPFGKGLYLHQSNYKINEFLDQDVWGQAASEMKRRSPELYKPNFLGLFGATTGLCYPEFNDSLFITGQDVMNMEIMDFAIGVDTGLSNGEGKKIKVLKNENADEKIRSATTMALIGITRNSEIVLIEEYFHTNDTSVSDVNTDTKEPLEYPQLIQQCATYIQKWINKYSGNTKKGNFLMKGTINVFVDNADIITIGELERVCHNAGMFNVEVGPCTKLRIQSRVDFERLMMAYGKFKVVAANCPNAVREYKLARKGEKGEARAPGNDHLIDSVNYSWAPFRTSLDMWKDFKEH